MPDYQNGKIYKLWSPEGDEIYIGSTTQSLARRKSRHKSQTDGCKSKILFEKYTDVRIELLEEVSCDNKEQLAKKEGEYIRNNHCVNKCVAGRTNKERHKEYYENNKEHIKEYYENNKEHIQEQKKEYYENNKEHIQERKSTEILCECGKTIRLGDKARHLKTKIHNKLK
tara:strand:- start:15 stop:524 length:510 start_codon:yes stop_codon:yes gene_type:complete